jgi:hypothetical protein
VGCLLTFEIKQGVPVINRTELERETEREIREFTVVIR